MAEVRNSFEQENSTEGSRTENGSAEGLSYIVIKLRVLIAILLLSLFVFLKLTGAEILGYQAKDVVDRITDNHYYTDLQNKEKGYTFYDKIGFIR